MQVHRNRGGSSDGDSKHSLCFSLPLLIDEDSPLLWKAVYIHQPCIIQLQRFRNQSKGTVSMILWIPIDAHSTKMIIPFSDIMRIQKIRSGYIFHSLSILTQNKKEVSGL